MKPACSYMVKLNGKWCMSKRSFSLHVAGKIQMAAVFIGFCCVIEFCLYDQRLPYSNSLWTQAAA